MTHCRNMTALLAFAGLASIGFAQDAVLRETVKAVPERTVDGDQYGHAVVFGTGFWAASAIGNDDLGEDAGAVFSYTDTSFSGLPLAEMHASDGSPGDLFGWSLGMMHDNSTYRMVIGAPGDDALGVDSGSAYLFQPRTGAQLAKYVASDGQAGDEFGFSSAIYYQVDREVDEFVVVGALSDSPTVDAGAVYVFDLETGAERFKLQPAGIGGGAEFGYSVATDGSVIVVGAPGDWEGGQRTGAMYVYDAQSGDLLHRFTASDGSGGDRFGHSVGVYLGRVYAGAPGRHGGGAGYAFSATTGDALFVALPSDGYVEELGWSVSASFDGVIFGAPGDDQEVENGGSALRFAYSTGQFRGKAIPSQASENGRFGASLMSNLTANTLFGVPGSDRFGAVAGATVRHAYWEDFAELGILFHNPPGFSPKAYGADVDVDGGVAIIGTPTDDDGAYHMGSASLIDVASGEHLHTLTPFDGSEDDTFGHSVAIGSGVAAVRSHFSEPPPSTIPPAAVYLYSVADGVLLHKLTTPELSPGVYAEAFGFDPIFEDGLLYMSAQRTRVAGVSEAGVVLVYEPISGSLVRTIEPAVPTHDAQFGNLFVVDDGLIAIASYTDFPGTSDRYFELYDSTTGSIIGRVDEMYPGLGALDVESLAMGDGFLVVRTVAGEMIVYDSGTTAMLGTIEAQSMHVDSEFGEHFAIDGGKLLVSDFGELPNGREIGPAYVFDLATLSLDLTLEPDILDGDGEFGSLALRDGVAVLGAPSYSDFSELAGPGGVFVFDINEINCPMDLNGDSSIDFFDVSAFLIAYNSQDPLADLNGDGSFNFFDVSAFLTGYVQGCM